MVHTTVEKDLGVGCCIPNCVLEQVFSYDNPTEAVLLYLLLSKITVFGSMIALGLSNMPFILVIKLYQVMRLEANFKGCSWKHFPSSTAVGFSIVDDNLD